MKKDNILLIAMLFIGALSNAQVLSNGVVANQFSNENVFLDASTNNNSTTNDGKGLQFPTTDLSVFTFNVASLDGINFPTAYNGMMVYNSATGNTLPSVGDNNGIVTAVTPGYYYFKNEGGTTSVTGGTWTPLGSTSVKNISSTETATSTSIDGKQVYALKGEFTTLGVTALISITKPTDMTGYYKMTTYIGGKTFRSEISSLTVNLDPLVTTVEVVTGNGLFSEVYPVGTYTYTLEYFKS